MNKANLDIRSKATEAGVKLWQIAAGLGVNDVTFTKRLRFELSTEEKHRIFALIDEISKREEG